MEQNFETPEELLEAIGFGGLEKKRTISDGLGFNYKMPPYELVQVSRPASNIQISTFGTEKRAFQNSQLKVYKF